MCNLVAASRVAVPALPPPGMRTASQQNIRRVKRKAAPRFDVCVESQFRQALSQLPSVRWRRRQHFLWSCANITGQGSCSWSAQCRRGGGLALQTMYKQFGRAAGHGHRPLSIACSDNRFVGGRPPAEPRCAAPASVLQEARSRSVVLGECSVLFVRDAIVAMRVRRQVPRIFAPRKVR